MIKVYSEIVPFRGSHYDFGVYQGKLLLHSPILSNRKKQWKKMNRHFQIDRMEVLNAFQSFAPKLLEEIQGLADSLKMSFTDALREFGGYYIEYGNSGCSIYTDNGFMVRNYDNDPLSYEGRFVLFQPNNGFAAIGPSMQITGRTDGINEHGLAIGYNFVHRKKTRNGFICNMIARIILETCQNKEEAIDLLKEIPHRHSFIYVLSDPDGSVIVEASPRKVVARTGNWCTNHFDILTEENRYRMQDSRQRWSAIAHRQRTLANPYDAFRMMNDPASGVFSEKYGAWAGTIHTAQYFPREKKIWFAIGGNRKPLIIDGKHWFEGKDIPVKRIKGELNSRFPFVNMAPLA